MDGGAFDAPVSCPHLYREIMEMNAAPAEAPKRCSHHGKTKPTESRTGSGAMLRDNAVAFHHQTGPEVELSLRTPDVEVKHWPTRYRPAPDQMPTAK